MKTIQFSKSDNPLDIRFDNIFKAVFTKNSSASRQALSDLVSAFIKRTVTVKTITANEPPADDVRNRHIRFDISCFAKNGELINIEMSFNPESHEPVRLEYHCARLFIWQDIKGIKKDYSDLKETYQIAILSKRLFFRDKALVHTFRYHDPVNHVSLGGKTRIITVELPKARQALNKPVGKLDAQEAWAVFFQYLTDRGKREKINEILKREAGIAMAGEELIRISRNDRERARLLSEWKYALDIQCRQVSAERRGIKKGLREGRKEGREEGRVEGRTEGRIDEKFDIARKLKARGRSLKEIAEDTGLSIKHIEKL